MVTRVFWRCKIDVRHALFYFLGFLRQTAWVAASFNKILQGFRVGSMDGWMDGWREL
jgi:hypothetical protein